MRKSKCSQYTVCARQEAIPCNLLLATRKQEEELVLESTISKAECTMFDDFETNDDDLWLYET